MKNFGREGQPDPDKVKGNDVTEVFKGSETLEIVDYHIETNISWFEVI